MEKPGTIGGAPSIQVVNLDPICTPYRRILFSLRIIRALMASLIVYALIFAVSALYFALVDGILLAHVIAVAVVMSFVLSLSIGLYFWWHRLSQGSITAARIGVWVNCVLAALSATVGLATVTGDLLATGAVWFHLAAYAMSFSIFAALAAGTVALVKSRDDEGLRSVLSQNTRRSWRETFEQLFGIVLPRGRSLRALTRKGVLLSVLALFIEGITFGAFFNATRPLLKASDRMVSAARGKLAPLEAHYGSVVTLAAFVFPLMYVSAQLTLAVAERIRAAARRASLRSAEDLLKEDERTAILFLRDFTDDQVSLDKTALPRWVRALDPGAEQTNLEDVMLAYSWVGPVVAIGRPYDAEPPVGAARRYVDGEAWKEVVSTMMDRAGAIVIGFSESSGVLWEIAQVQKRGHLGKSVFVLPPSKRNNSALTRELVTRLLCPADSFSSRHPIAAVARQVVGSRHVSGLILREGYLRIFIATRRVSQVELDVTLRLALPEGVGDRSRDGVRVPES